MLKIDRAKLLVILSFVLSIPAGYYFISADILQAVVYMILSDMTAGMASRFQKKSGGWALPIKTAIERCTDASIFIGFALSGAVPRAYGFALLVAAIILPFWTRAIWKMNVRWVFHAVVYLYILLAVA